MKCGTFTLLFLIALLALTGCGKKSGPAPSVSQQQAVVPTICVYTMGKVDNGLQRAMFDSLRAHYPKCRMAGHLPLPESARTTKRNDHRRYRADLLNKVLAQYKTDSTIVVGLTQADICLDNFRGRPHSGIMGMANGIGTGVAVFSSYRPRGNGDRKSVV